MAAAELTNESSAAELNKELELIKHEERTLLRIKQIIKQQLESLKIEESLLKQKIVKEQCKMGLLSSDRANATIGGGQERDANTNGVDDGSLEIDEDANKFPSSTMELASLPTEASCMRRPQFDQQSSITSELSALYLYENQRLPVYDEFQSDDYANLEPLKALTPEDLKMLSLPDSEDSATDSTHEIDQYWSHGGSDTASTSQMTSSFVPFATSTQVATSSFDDVTEVTGSQMTTLSCANPMPELSIDDLNPSESFVFSSVNEEEEEEEDDEEEDNELHVKFL